MNGSRSEHWSGLNRKAVLHCDLPQNTQMHTLLHCDTPQNTGPLLSVFDCIVLCYTVCCGRLAEHKA